MNAKKYVYLSKDRILYSSIFQRSWENVDRGTFANIRKIEFAIDANYVLLLLLLFFPFS